MKHYVTSPNTGTRFRGDIPGFNIRWTQRGYCVLEVDFIADPAKRTKEWFVKERRKYTHRDWAREMGRDWTTAEGDAFFPEYAIHPAAYTATIGKLLPGPVVRGWDFGFRGPACVWMQVSPKGRVAIIREILPFNTEVHEFRDLVRYLSGEVTLEFLKDHHRQRALHWVHQIRAKERFPFNKYPDPPWFKGINKFFDYSGHEATATRSIQTVTSAGAGGEKRERNDAEVLAAGGINVNSGYLRRDEREFKVRRLLGSMDDGYAGLLVDPACAYLQRAFRGALAYPKPTPANPQPTDPARDGTYEHVWDAASYGVGNIVEITPSRDVKPAKEIWEGRRLTVEKTEFDRMLNYNVIRNRDIWKGRYL